MTSIDALISQKDSLAYWNNIDSTVNGMMGGYPHISRVDIRGSLNFISKLRSRRPKSILSRAADIGAGIGRVTAGVLSRTASTIDIVEPVSKFADQARQLGSDGDLTTMGDGRVGQVYVCGVEDWIPERKYDLIWIQWCLGHLKTEQAVTCLVRCGEALSEGGWIAVKENLSTNVTGEDVFDELDSSVTRTDASYRALFMSAGLKVCLTELQKGFPSELFPVRMYALRPS